MPHYTMSAARPQRCATYPYGGQAVIEGVMMKGRKHAAVAMRRKSGDIDVVEKELKSSFPEWLTKAPVARGFFLLWDMLGLGMWSLGVSQDKYLEDIGEKPAEGKGAQTAFVITAVASVILALAMFKLLPTFLVDTVDKHFVPVAGIGLKNALEGLIKFGVFVAYIVVIGRIPEIARVFMYHGAEHAVINAYEADPQGSMDEVKPNPLHPRCGTSFIVIFIIISAIIYYFFDRWLVALGVPTSGQWPIWYVRWPVRILAIPLLAGVSYEILKGAFALRRFIFIKPFIWLGMLFQVLTTRKPTPDAIAVAKAALAAVRAREEAVQ
jgi:uncharacterized protein YqhQ